MKIQNNRRESRFWSYPIVLLILAAFTAMGNEAMGQGRQYLFPSSMPTGSLANVSRLSGADQNWYQPVRINVPQGVNVSTAQEGGFQACAAGNLFAYLPGSVYRLRFSEIPLHADRLLYPTLEMLNRLYPPVGREYDFPVEIDITREDIELALSGKLVTRVIYLENQMGAIPVDSTNSAGKLSVDVNDGTNPVAVAEQRGTVMAVFRMGSRLPIEQPNSLDPFYFGCPPVMQGRPNHEVAKPTE